MQQTMQITLTRETTSVGASWSPGAPPATNYTTPDTMPRRKAILYFRVSTARQGRSGLGLDAQRETVAHFLDDGRWSVKAEFTEHESGRRRDRPELANAIKACRLHRATLIVAKLDRLSRNVAFLCELRDSGIQIIFADMPNAEDLTVNVLASVAQHEAKIISERTKAALAQAKARGTELGGIRPKHKPFASKHRKLAREAVNVRVRTRAAEIASDPDLAPLIAELRAGKASLREVAAELTKRGIATPRNAAHEARALEANEPPPPSITQWSAAQVSRLVRQIDELG